VVRGALKRADAPDWRGDESTDLDECCAGFHRQDVRQVSGRVGAESRSFMRPHSAPAATPLHTSRPDNSLADGQLDRAVSWGVLRWLALSSILAQE